MSASADHQLLYQRGRDLMDKGDYSEAATCFQASARLLPHFKTYELLGECWLELAEYQQSVMALAAAATLGTRQSRSLYLLAQALVALDEKEKALEMLDRALANNPEYASARTLKASLESGVAPRR